MSEFAHESLSKADRDVGRSNAPWAHTRLERFKRVAISQFESFSDSCRLCRLYRDLALTFAKGHLPSLFTPESMKEAEEKSIFQCLVIYFNNHGLKFRHPFGRNVIFHISGQYYRVPISRDTDVDRAFKIQGRRLPTGFRVERHTNSGMTFKLARKWLSECVTRHACSRPDSEAVPVPGRLLQIRGSANDSTQLVKTQGSEFPYVALSHRWSDPRLKQLKTTTRTMRSHMNQILWDDLPAKFQDAVTVFRSMDVEYLWIGSLSILQAFEGIVRDELEATGRDFAQENSKIATAYRNSHFTISANISSHMDSGMFSQIPVDDHAIPVMANDGEPPSLYIGQGVNYYKEETSGIETRAWTLQEFLLPPRVLYFGRFDIEWRCKQRLTCECGQLDRERTNPSQWHRHHFIKRRPNVILGTTRVLLGGGGAWPMMQVAN